jgi:gliding motility-associated-like protein
MISRFFLIGLLFNFSNIFSQQRIFATMYGGDLYSIDVVECDKNFVGSTGIGFGDIAFTTNGLLWGISNGELYNIDTVNASTTLIGSTGIAGVSLVGISDTILLTESLGNLYGINTNNGNSYFIGEIGYYAHGDLVLIDRTLFMVTPLIKIELNSDFSAILNVSPISLTLPPCEGAAVLNDGSIIGFSHIGIIKMCPNDSSYQIICSDLNIYGSPGAASFLDSSNDADLVNVFTPNGDGVNDFFQPLGELKHIENVIIFNRWGNIVNELTYPFIWDGSTPNGVKVKNGVYFYTIKKNDVCGNQIIKQSMIHLIR